MLLQQTVGGNSDKVQAMTYLTYYESSTSNESSSYDHGELDGAEPPVQKTTRSGQKTGHWPARFCDLVG